MIVALAVLAMAQGQDVFDDHANMMRLLGVRALRRGPDPNNQATFDEATANPHKDSMPKLMTFEKGGEVKTRADWARRRKEIAGLFEREVYGKVPKNVPKVDWEVTGVVPGISGETPIVTRNLSGRVDNRAFPQLEVNIQANVNVPVHAKGPVPVMIEFGGFGGRGGRFGAWRDLAISKGWGYGSINPGSIQPDNARLNTGTIGLCNKGGYRKPDDWGALRAWAWGLSKLIDAFEAEPSWGVDPKKVGIVGVSRYGKAALVAQAFDERVAVGFIGSSGEGGSKLHRRIFGEQIENLAGGAFYWMAGSIIKYGSADPFIDVSSLPVDSHQLIALCAPRPCFISHGIVEKGDAKWIDARGSFMAGVLAGPAYRLLGKKDFGTPGDYLTDPMPPVGTLIGGELAWRQHDAGHEVTPNWPPFFEWIGAYIAAPEIGPSRRPYPAKLSEPAPRADANSQEAHRQLLAKRTQGKIDLYFLGDSITRRWGTSDPAYKQLFDNWTKNFFGWNAGNFGWGADGVQHVLWRVRNGELDGVNPKAIVIQVGTNNLFLEADPGEIARGIRSIVEACRKQAPKATIVLTGIFPRNDRPGLWPVIQQVNRQIKALTNGKTTRFLDVNAALATKDGTLFEGMAGDGLHLTVKGNQVWADGLGPILTDILGPRAATDHAPPSTGDPGIGQN